MPRRSEYRSVLDYASDEAIIQALQQQGVHTGAASEHEGLSPGASLSSTAADFNHTGTVSLPLRHSFVNGNNPDWMLPNIAESESLPQTVTAEAQRLWATQKMLRQFMSFSEQENARLDALTRQVKEHYQVPWAAITVVDLGREWCKSVVHDHELNGYNDVPRRESFGAHVVLAKSGFVEVCHTAQDVRFCQNDHLRDGCPWRYYAGQAIWHDGQRVGTLCLHDCVPRPPMTAAARHALAAYGRQAQDLLEEWHGPECNSSATSDAAAAAASSTAHGSSRQSTPASMLPSSPSQPLLEHCRKRTATAAVKQDAALPIPVPPEPKLQAVGSPVPARTRPVGSADCDGLPPSSFLAAPRRSSPPLIPTIRTGLPMAARAPRGGSSPSSSLLSMGSSSSSLSSPPKSHSATPSPQQQAQSLTALLVPDPMSDGVDPDTYLAQMLEVLHKIKANVKPAQELQNYFLPVSDAQVAAYNLETVTLLQNGDLEGMKTVFAKHGRSSLNCFNHFGEGLLHTACRRGMTDIVQFLLSPPVHLDVRVSDDYGRTPLHDACWNPEPQLDIVKLLLLHEPTLMFVADRRGYTAFQYARQHDWPVWRQFLYNERDTVLAHLAESPRLPQFVVVGDDECDAAMKK